MYSFLSLFFFIYCFPDFLFFIRISFLFSFFFFTFPFFVPLFCSTFSLYSFFFYAVPFIFFFFYHIFPPFFSFISLSHSHFFISPFLLFSQHLPSSTFSSVTLLFSPRNSDFDFFYPHKNVSCVKIYLPTNTTDLYGCFQTFLLVRSFY